MKKKKSEPSDPLSFAVMRTDGVPADTTALLHKYGTYEVQDTADTENELPAIAQGLAESQKTKKLEKEDIGKTDAP